MKTSELTRKLKRDGGASLLEHRGEHDYWFCPLTGKTVVVPRHPAREIPTGTANRILKDAGLK